MSFSGPSEGNCKVGIPPPPRPVPPEPRLDTIPAELRALPQWVLWHYVLNGKKDNWTKAPLQTNGAEASTKNANTWAPFDAVTKAYDPKRFDGIGLVTSADDPYLFIDLDKVLDAGTGAISEWAREIVATAEQEDAYIEKSPSGTGFHIIGRGEQMLSGRKNNDAEMYSWGRYFTCTGNGSAPAVLGTLSKTPKLVLRRIDGDKAKRANGAAYGGNTATGGGFPGDDEARIQAARGFKNGDKFSKLFDATEISGDYKSESEADAALIALLGFVCGPDAERIERLMHRSNRSRDKWDTERSTDTGSVSYLRYSIDRWLKTPNLKFYTPRATAVTLEDFYAYMPSHQYLFTPNRELWPMASVNARLPPVTVAAKKKVSASRWLDTHRAVEQAIWAPGQGEEINDRLVANGGWLERKGCRCFNLYIPPIAVSGHPNDAGRWLEHVSLLYPTDAEHIVKWLAQRVQHPDIKINHALVLGGPQGIGKDTILEPAKTAIGQWNFAEVTPKHMFGDFNSFVKSVILLISEIRDLGDVDRYAFYEHMKGYTAAPPDILRCNEKNLREHSVVNVCGVIMTTNHKNDGIYLPVDDRRHYVAWSSLTKEDFAAEYFRDLYSWYAAGGDRHVAAYLAQLDISAFDPKAPPPKTLAFWDIVDANRAPEDAELADVLDLLGNPPALTLADLQIPEADGEFCNWLGDRRNRRQIPHRLEAVGYVSVRYDGADHGLWTVAGKRQAIYAPKAHSIRDRMIAARNLVKDREPRK